MKYFVFSCLLVLATQSYQQAPTVALPATNLFVSQPQTFDHGGDIESKYDGFSHETVATLKKMKVTCAGQKGNFKDSCVSFVASLHCPGLQLDYVRYATLQLVFQTKDWDQRHPVDQRELLVVADGETIRIGRMELVSQNVDTLMTEVLRTTLSYDIFKRIALAETVEMQVGKSRFEFREENLAALRDLNNRVKPGRGRG
jgi:hypothetical protein